MQCPGYHIRLFEFSVFVAFVSSNFSFFGKLDENGKRLPMSVKKGQRVLIGKYTGQDIKINDEEHTIVREDEILAIIEK